MRISISILKTTLRVPATLVLYIAVLLACIKLKAADFDILLGIPSGMDARSIDYLKLARWMVIMSMPILANGFILERSSAVELLSEIRFKKRTVWRICVATACVMNSFIWFLCVAVGELLGGEAALLPFSLVFMPNCLMWSMAALAFYSLSGRKPWSGAVAIFSLGGTYILSRYFPSLAVYMPSTWGMFCSSSLYQSDGCSVLFMLTMNLLISAVCVILFIEGEKLIWKKYV